MELGQGLVALQAAVDLMSNNKYHEAVRLLKPKSVTSQCTLLPNYDSFPVDLELSSACITPWRMGQSCFYRLCSVWRG